MDKSKETKLLMEVAKFAFEAFLPSDKKERQKYS